MVKPSRSQEASGDVERLPCEAHALVHASGQTVTRSLGRQLGIQLVRKRRSRTTLSPRRRKAREASKASRHARARPEMRPFRPHRRNPARTVLPLDGSRGVESPGIESIGTRRSVASRSETGHRNSPPIATNAPRGAWKISLPHQKVNATPVQHPRDVEVCEILTGASGSRRVRGRMLSRTRSRIYAPLPPPRSMRSVGETARSILNARFPRN
jgi:hypothetical protein